jgi:hypothetical protein
LAPPSNPKKESGAAITLSLPNSERAPKYGQRPSVNPVDPQAQPNRECNLTDSMQGTDGDSLSPEAASRGSGQQPQGRHVGAETTGPRTAGPELGSLETSKARPALLASGGTRESLSEPLRRVTEGLSNPTQAAPTRHISAHRWRPRGGEPARSPVATECLSSEKRRSRGGTKDERWSDQEVRVRGPGKVGMPQESCSRKEMGRCCKDIQERRRGGRLAPSPAKEEADNPTKCSNKWRRTKKEHCMCFVKILRGQDRGKRLENSRKQIDLLSRSTPGKHRYGYSLPFKLTEENF